jgi:streptogramin lyase
MLHRPHKAIALTTLLALSACSDRHLKVVRDAASETGSPGSDVRTADGGTADGPQTAGEVSEAGRILGTGGDLGTGGAIDAGGGTGMGGLAGVGGVTGAGGAAGTTGSKDAGRDLGQPSLDAKDAAAGGAPSFVKFTLSSYLSPNDMTLGPDGNIWFTSHELSNEIYRITLNSKLDGFHLSDTSASAVGITTGPDGNLWATSRNGLVQMTPDGEFTLYALSGKLAAPTRIASGSDKAVWVVDTAGAIGRMATDGSISAFPVPTSNAGLQDIALGSDGALWFTEASADRIGRITTDGVLTEYSLPSSKSTPSDIAPGPDGALWFTESTGNRIGRITTAGAITEFAIPTPNSKPSGIVAGPDGAIWFTEHDARKIGRITPDGAVVEYAIPNLPSGSKGGPQGIVVVPNGDVWFGYVEESYSGWIGRMTPPGRPPTPYCILRYEPTTTPSFGNPVIGTSSEPQTFVFSNQGNAPSGKLVASVASEQPDAGLFSIVQDTCGTAPLDPGQSCKVTVVFKPSAESSQNYRGTLVLTPGLGDPYSVLLDALCYHRCALWAISNFDFGDLARNTTSNTQTASVGNGGTAVCQELSMSIDNPNPSCARFSITANTCAGATLDVGNSCTFNISFTPTCTSATSYTANVVFTPQDGDGASVFMQGTCTK